MWNRGFRIIWVKIHLTGAKHFYLNLPVSLYALEELLQCAADLTELACLFIPKKLPSYSGSPSPVRAANELLEASDLLLRSLTAQGSYELVEVNTEHVSVSIKIR